MNIKKGDVVIEFWYTLTKMNFFLDIYFSRPFQQLKEGQI
jgi:hypothetical protein